MRQIQKQKPKQQQQKTQQTHTMVVENDRNACPRSEGDSLVTGTDTTLPSSPFLLASLGLTFE